MISAGVPMQERRAIQARPCRRPRDSPGWYRSRVPRWPARSRSTRCKRLGPRLWRLIGGQCREVAKERRGVVGPRELARRAQQARSARLPVVNGDRRDRQDLVVARRHVSREIRAVVSGGCHVRHPGSRRCADRCMQRIVIRQATVSIVASPATQAHVRDRDVVGRVRVQPCRGHVVDAAQHGSIRAIPVLCQDADRPKLCAGDDADDLQGIVGDVGPSSLAATIPATCVPCPFASS
jgi:hypothetical protein